MEAFFIHSKLRDNRFPENMLMKADIVKWLTFVRLAATKRENTAAGHTSGLICW